MTLNGKIQVYDIGVFYGKDGTYVHLVGDSWVPYQECTVFITGHFRSGWIARNSVNQLCFA